MIFSATRQWLTVCLHYQEPWEALLVKAVKPYADVVLQTGVAEHFHFERSLEGGPHIRLWFKGSPDILADMLQPNIGEHFQQYFESQPIAAALQTYPADFVKSRNWYPNYTIRYLMQQPQFAQKQEGCWYERQYRASSALVLQMLKEQVQAGGQTRQELTAAALRLHLSMAFSAGMTQEEAAVFFQKMYRQWVNVCGREAHQSSDRIFRQLFEVHRSNLLPFCSALWELFKNHRKMDDPLFLKWFRVNAHASEALRAGYEGVAPHSSGLFEIFSNFIRTTGNRMGLSGRHEGYVYYMCFNCLAAMQTPASAVVLANAR